MNLPRANPATVARIRETMSSALDWPATPIRMRYLLLSQARTGGTFLCEALSRSGMAGVPSEYLNPAAIAAMAKRLGASGGIALPQLMQELEGRRTTSNGVFGLHLHLEQLRKPLETEERILRWLERFDRIILLVRRNKLAQAVSLDRALQTKAWFQTADLRENSTAPSLVVRPATLAAHIMRLFEQETLMRRSVAALGRPALEIDYESLDSDFASLWSRVAEFLDLGPIPVASVMPDLERMRDASNDVMAERFIAILRDSDLARDPAFLRVAPTDKGERNR
ncbi:MAG: Stf0 family sulfotransferase [Rhodospirillaceae bacterium]|nr:Stf0 family sulfotransferase [Rhodospirillaceae bacterium]